MKGKTNNHLLQTSHRKLQINSNNDFYIYLFLSFFTSNSYYQKKKNLIM